MTMTMDINNDIATITLDDGKANAIDWDWMAAFIKLLDKAESEAKALIITGRSGVFSGGFNLKKLPNASRDQLSQLLDDASEMLARIYESKLPIIAACSGHAIAMGSFFLCACDTRIGIKGDYKFGANETLNNMNLPVFAVELPRDRLDPHYMTRSLIQSEMYGVDDAIKAGYLDMAVDEDMLMTTANGLAQKLAQLPARAYGANKNLVRGRTIGRIRDAIGSY